MAKGTKQRILDEALTMFSERGYEGTNMRELAQTLGLGKSALYRHFQSKEDIWNSLLDQIEEHYSEQFGSDDNLPPIPASCEEFLQMAKSMLDFTLHDRRVKLARQLLLTEQFRDARAKDLAEEHFLARTERIFAHVFSGMVEAGLLKDGDPEMMALAFSAPITVLIMQCDRSPETESESVARIHAFMEHFISVYGADAVKSPGKGGLCTHG